MDVFGFMELLCADHPAAMVLTDAPPPGVPPTILNVNPAFVRLCGYPAEEVIGRSPAMLQGSRTDKRAARSLSQATRRGEAATAVILNYRKDGTPYLAEISLRPVSAHGDGTVTHFVGLAREVERRLGRPGACGRFRPTADAPHAPHAFAPAA